MARAHIARRPTGNHAGSGRGRAAVKVHKPMDASTHAQAAGTVSSSGSSGHGGGNAYGQSK